MLWNIFLLLVTMWLLGVVTAFTLYGVTHVLLLLALGGLVFRVIQARRVNSGRLETEL